MTGRNGLLLGVTAALLLAVGLWTAYAYFAGTGGSRGGVDVPETDVLATVDGMAITREAIRREMARRGGGLEGQYQTPEQRRALLDRMIEQRVLVAVAKREGFDRDADVIKHHERAMVDKLHAVRVEPLIEQLRVSDAEVAAHYQAHQQEYARPARRRGAVILARVPPGASAEAVQESRTRIDRAIAEAAELDAEVLHFGPLARQYSDDQASRYQGGVIGWLVQHPGRRYRCGDAVVAALFDLERPGDISPVIRTPEGFLVVRLVSAEPASVRPLERLESGIRNRLLQDKRVAERRRFLQQAVAEIEVRVNEQSVAATAPLSAPAPPRLPPKPPTLP